MSGTIYLKIFGECANTPEIISKCDHLCSLFGLSTDDLFSSWESYAYTEHKNSNLKVTPELLDGLQKFIQERMTLNNKSRPAASQQVKKRKLNNEETSNSLVSSNTILESINSQIEDKETTISNKNIKLVAQFNRSKYKYKTMNLKLLEIADYLDERIDLFTQLISERYNLTENQFSDPTRQSQSEIYTVGRIVPDSPFAPTSSALNLDSLYLETSRASGFGQRVPLDLGNVSNFSFFPGQIVAFRGINTNGSCFKVIENLKIPYLGSSTFTRDEIMNFAEVLGDDNLKIIITSGPYHSKNSLNFAYLDRFVRHLNETVKPDIVIMLGPFIDATSLPTILSSQFFNSGEDTEDLKSIDDLFLSYVSPILNEIQCSRIIILPHSSDPVAHTCYPQAPFNRKTLGLNKNFKCFPNPSLFNINELSFGISTTDIIKDLKDIPTKDANSNRIERIIEHVIQQRQFYPVHPSPQSPDTLQIDTSYLGLTEFDEELPDIFVFPSIVRHFAKIIKNSVCVNPGQFLRQDGNPGTYALLQVKSPDTSDLKQVKKSGTDDDDDEEVYEAFLSTAWKRTRVDIYNV